MYAFVYNLIFIIDSRVKLFVKRRMGCISKETPNSACQHVAGMLFIYILFYFLTMCLATSTRAVYTREELLALLKKHPIPTELRNLYCGYRTGAKLKTKRHNKRWRYKPFLPSVIMGNANSLLNKCDELKALVRNQLLYKESRLICLSESWLNDNTPDSCMDIPVFTAVRADRDRNMSGKRKDEGIILFFNQRWVNPRNVTIKERICCPDIELLSVGFRAFYAPRAVLPGGK